MDHDGRRAPAAAVRVCLLIPTHALPPLSYQLPEHLAGHVGVGSAVVAPLSGYSRTGVVVGFDDEDDGRTLEEVRVAVRGLSLPPSTVELCVWVAEYAAVPLSTVLRAALPPGLSTERYWVLAPAPGWPWGRGELVGRTTLRRALGADGLRRAEEGGRLRLAPGTPEPPTVEWAMVEDHRADLGRAPRQRELFESLWEHEGGLSVPELMEATAARRETLRALVRRGAVGVRRRPEPPPDAVARGGGAELKSLQPFMRTTGRLVDRGGTWVWRTPTAEQADAAAAVALATVEDGDQALILAPERAVVERLVAHLSRTLPAGFRVSPYHGGLGRRRARVYEAARNGAVDVLVGTRAAAVLPLARPGAVCVVDEPNEAHRAEPGSSAGYEGLPVHVREVARRRGELEGAGVLYLSPRPSLKVSAARELPARPARLWPRSRIVDLRGSGALLSPDLLSAVEEGARSGGRAAVVANRLGHATAVACNHCGYVRRCPNCGLPLALHGGANDAVSGRLVCGRCGFQESYNETCRECGSGRLVATGLGAERLRAEISSATGVPAGLITAGARKLEDAPVIVGTARYVLEGEWGVVAVPDPDALLLGSSPGSTERAFRLLHGAAEAARNQLVVQTRHPDHHVLRAALSDDYPAFAAAEMPRLRALGYPPYGHLAELTFAGEEEAVRRAVESGLRPALPEGVEISGLVPLSGGLSWRVLLRSGDRRAVARAAASAARQAARTRGLQVEVNMDPEEV